jgi:hypothetical protein
VVEALAEAEELAPHLVMAGDIVLAVRRMPSSQERALFELAFDPPAPPLPSATAEYEAESNDGAAVPAQPEEMTRSAGALVTSTELATVWKIIHALAQQNAEPWARAAQHPGELPLRAVAHAEAELGTTLPDDFWAAAAAGVMGLSRLGVTPTRDHGEPVPAHEVAEAVLTVASDAASELDDDLVAIMDLRETGAGARGDFLCVHRGVSFSKRNAQPVFLAGPDGLERQRSFAAYLVRVLREMDAPMDSTTTSTVYRPRLVE